MIHINEYITEAFQVKEVVNEMLDEIDIDILLESFKSSTFQAIVDQTNKLIAKDKEEAKERGYSFWNKYRSFKQLFGRESIAWDKITDDMMKEGSKSDEKCMTDLKKQIRKLARDTSEYGGAVIVLLNDNEKDEDKKYIGMIIVNSWGQLECKSLLSAYRNEIFKVTKLDDYLTQKFLYCFLTDDIRTWDKERERSNSREGMIMPGDKDQYKKIAEQNRERYKKIIAKNHAEQDATDGLRDKVKEYVDKVMDIVTLIDEDPGKYGPLEYEIQYLLELVGDRRSTWVDKGKLRGNGTDGLLYLFAQYMHLKLSQAKGDSYSFERKDYLATKKQINDVFKKIDEKIDKINTKIQELAA